MKDVRETAITVFCVAEVAILLWVAWHWKSVVKGLGIALLGSLGLVVLCAVADFLNAIRQSLPKLRLRVATATAVVLIVLAVSVAMAAT